MNRKEHLLAAIAKGKKKPNHRSAEARDALIVKRGRLPAGTRVNLTAKQASYLGVMWIPGEENPLAVEKAGMFETMQALDDLYRQHLREKVDADREATTAHDA